MDDCLLGAMIQVIRQRELIPEARLRKLHANCNVDKLWSSLGAVIDDLEEGLFSV